MPGQASVQLRTGGVECRREHRKRRVQLPSHARPLRTLAGEDDTNGAVARRTAFGHTAQASGADVTLSATTTARCSRTVRAVANDRATAARSVSSSSASANRAACLTSASAERADTTNGTGPSTGLSLPATGSTCCSRMTWALVPEIPKAETPARRARPVRGQASGSVSRRTDPADQSTLSDGESTCSVCGNTPCRIASTTLITPATPAAAWV